MSIGRACGGYFLTAGNGESGFANRDRQPEAGSLHYALAHPCPRVGSERLYTLLRPTACQGGEGHAVARGDCRRHAESRKLRAGSREPEAASRQPIAESRKPEAESRQPTAVS